MTVWARVSRSAEYQQYRSLNTIEEEDESFEEKMATQAQSVPQNDQRITSTSSAGSGTGYLKLRGYTHFCPKLLILATKLLQLAKSNI